MMKLKVAPFKYSPFSIKQIKVFTWWMDTSPVRDKDVIICDGAVRSGKTLPMSLSFVFWSMEKFNGQNFGMAGKTIGALRRNVIVPLRMLLLFRGYRTTEKRSDNLLIVTRKGKQNFFYIFGGKDERSQDLIQGITLAGMLFDEVALMPESFVNQATARCSVDGARLWFNCNPEGPYHWFKTEWIEKLEEKNAIHLHFTMDDNTSLSERVKERYRRMYSGVFYARYILGLWVMAEGIIYPGFDEKRHCISERDLPEQFTYFYIGSDYGITNPMVFLKCGILMKKGLPYFYIYDEYYNKGNNGRIKTDVVFLDDYQKFIAPEAEKPKALIIDPSATSLINLFGENDIRIKEANNEVLDGIANISALLEQGRLFIVKSACPNLVKEFSSYVWDKKAQQKGIDAPVKESDHALDALRYLAQTLFPFERLRKIVPLDRKRLGI